MKNLNLSTQWVLGILGTALLTLSILWEMGFYSYHNIPLDYYEFNPLQQLPNILFRVLIFGLVLALVWFTSYPLLKLIASTNTSTKWNRVLTISLYISTRFLLPFGIALRIYYLNILKPLNTLFYAVVLFVIYSIILLFEWRYCFQLNGNPHLIKSKTFTEMLNVLSLGFNLSTFLIWYCSLSLCAYSLGYSYSRGKKEYLSFDNGNSLIVAFSENEVLTVTNNTELHFIPVSRTTIQGLPLKKVKKSKKGS